MQTVDTLIGASFGLLGAVLFAISVVVYRSQSDRIAPIAVGSIKMWASIPLMLGLVVIQGTEALFEMSAETTIILSLSVMFSAVVGDTIYIRSQELVGVSYAFPIAMSFPLITYIMTVTLLGEQFVALRLVGAAITVAGVVILSNEQHRKKREDMETSSRKSVLGLALAFVTALLWAGGVVILQVGVSEVDPVPANFIRVIVGSVAFVPIYALGRHTGMRSPNSRTAALVAITGFFGMGVGSLMHVFAVKLAGAAITSVVGATSPLFAVPFSMVLLREKVGMRALAGIMATVVGVILVVIAPYP
ncbi:MAG: DMT family transporter [Candidatus Thorarchaeota archaeon]